VRLNSEYGGRSLRLARVIVAAFAVFAPNLVTGQALTAAQLYPDHDLQEYSPASMRHVQFPPRTARRAVLLFRSGFDGEIQLAPISGKYSTYQEIRGTDSLTNFTWPLTAFNPNPQLTGIQIVIASARRAAPDDINDYIDNRIVTVPGPAAYLTRALLMKVLKRSPATCCIQENLQTASVAAPPMDMYERFSIRFNPELRRQVQSRRKRFWRTVWSMKTKADYRIEAYVYGDANGDPYWYAHGDNNPAGPPLVEYWSASNKSVPVPLDEWALVEIYLHRSTGSDGRFFWAVNGKTVIDHYGPNYGSRRQPVNVFMYSSVYGSIFPMYQWIDDLEIWTAPPCPSLPCDSPRSHISSRD